jgi:hypothetical protein
MDKDLEQFEDELLQFLEISISSIQDNDLKEYAARLAAYLHVIKEGRTIKEY